MFRSKKILDAARDMTCKACGADDGTVVMAHSNRYFHGKGRGIKAHDCFVAALCMRCHDAIDGRTRGLSVAERQELWAAAHDKTILALFESGVIK